jgi:hypothetical protein
MSSFGFIGWFGGFSVAPCLVLAVGAQLAASWISARHSWLLASFRCCWSDRPLCHPIGPPLRRTMCLVRVWVRCRRISVPTPACASPLLRLYPPSTRRDLLRAASAEVVKPVVGLSASRRVMSQVPLPHNRGDPRARHGRSQQMDVWYALT